MREQFASACKWLAALDAPISNNRLSLYRKAIDEIVSQIDKGAIQQYSDNVGFDNIVRSLMEISQINRIFEGLGSHDSPGLRKRLKQVTGGAASLLDEKADGAKNLARNIAFELEVAAWLSESGYQVNLEDDCDIWIEGLKRPVAVECKRPFSIGGVERNVKDGLRQIKARSKQRTNTWGLLCLSLTRTENDGSLQMRAEHLKDLNDQTEVIIRGFAQSHRDLWKDAAKGNTIAVLLHLVVPAILIRPELQVYSVQVCFCKTTNPKSLSACFVDSLNKRTSIRNGFRMAGALESAN